MALLGGGLVGESFFLANEVMAMGQQPVCAENPPDYTQFEDADCTISHDFDAAMAEFAYLEEDDPIKFQKAIEDPRNCTDFVNTCDKLFPPRTTTCGDNQFIVVSKYFETIVFFDDDQIVNFKETPKVDRLPSFTVTFNASGEPNSIIPKLRERKMVSEVLRETSGSGGIHHKLLARFFNRLPEIVVDKACCNNKLEKSKCEHVSISSDASHLKNGL